MDWTQQRELGVESFSTVSTVLSMVLGLSITRLLLGVITVFRIRRVSTVHWIPLAWAACLFLIQLEYWWAVSQLPQIRPNYSFTDFVSLVVLTLTLFLAAALILPNRSEDEQVGLIDYFGTDGRFALLAIAAFHVIGFFANTIFLGQPTFAVWSLLDIPLTALPIAGFLAKTRQWQMVTVLFYVPLLLVDLWISIGVQA